MKLVAQCPFKQPAMICISDQRYQPIEPGQLPERPLSRDLPGLLWTGECTCCAKATGQG